MTANAVGSSLLNVFGSPFARMAYQWIGGVAIVCFGVYQTNVAQLVIVGLAWLCFKILCKLSKKRKVFLTFNTREYRRQERETYFPNRLEYFVVVGWVVPTLFLSLFVHVPLFFVGQRAIEKASGESSYYEGGTIALYNPFTDTLRNYWYDQSQSFSRESGNACIGKTSDGRSVVAHTAATLTLPFPGLPLAHEAFGSQVKLIHGIRAELCRVFVASVQRHAAIDLPRTFIIASDVAGNTSGMNEFGVLFDGVVEVSEPVAYNRQSDGS